ncbi:unnamed protein product, partial [Rotaria sordida]
MATATNKTLCIKCKKSKTTMKCSGCSKDFCFDHIDEHRNELSEQLGTIEDQFNDFKIGIDEQKADRQKHELMKQINRWERKSIEKIRQVANEVRHELSSRIVIFTTDLDVKLKQLTQKIIQCRKENDFADQEIQDFNEELERLRDILNKPPDFKIKYDTTSFISKIHLNMKTQLSRNTNLNVNAKWIQNGITVAGGNAYGSEMNQLYSPRGLCIDDDQTVYIAEWTNHRIVEWKSGAMTGRVVAGGNGLGNRPDQLNGPTDMIIDRERDNFIICDHGNRRVVRWPRQNGKNGETIISNVGCFGLTMHDDGFLYVADYDRHEVRRYPMGEDQGIVVAGGNGQGNRLDQLNNPTFTFVDRDHSLYVTDYSNHRVMKWMAGAEQGIIVAGGQGQGNSLTQLLNPGGVIVDQSGAVYVADQSNHRVVRWAPGATQGSVVVGGNGSGDQLNQLSFPIGLSFDQEASAARVSTQTPDTECERHSRRQNYDSCLPSNCLLAHTQGLPSKQCLNDIQDYLHPLQHAEPSKPIGAMPLVAYNNPNIFPGSTEKRPREVIELSIAEQNFLEYFGDKILDKIRKEQGIEDVKVKDGKLQLSGNSLTITTIKSYLKQVLHEQNVIIPNSLKKYLQLSAKGCLMKRFLQKYSLGISYLEISTNPSLNTNDIITIKNRANDHDKYEREKQYDSDRDMDQSEDDDDDNRKNDVSNTLSNVANISSNLKHCRLYAQKFIQLTLCNDSKDLLSKAIKELKSYNLYTQLWTLTQDEITYILKQPQPTKPSKNNTKIGNQCFQIKFFLINLIRSTRNSIVEIFVDYKNGFWRVKVRGFKNHVNNAMSKIKNWLNDNIE